MPRIQHDWWICISPYDKDERKLAALNQRAAMIDFSFVSPLWQDATDPFSLERARGTMLQLGLGFKGREESQRRRRKRIKGTEEAE
jgi:hypothetical protein